jgi:2',3'-cyclic-nucleotide 2'-phosphodiesterase (5'-nucleotidase family)
MKRPVITLIIACMLAFSGIFPTFTIADAAEEVTGITSDSEQVAAVILHTNDVHVAFEDNIGYDGLALYKKELEAVYDHVLLIDAGDAIQGAPIGSISKGSEIIRMMNRLGYDLAVPGNHEFDYGFEALDACAGALDCGYTCANFCVTGGETVFRPWRILEAGELKIGFVGAVAPDTFTKSIIKDILNEVGEPMYDFLADETGERLCAGLQKAIDEVRQSGADYVILVSHLGNNDSITAQFRTDPIVGKLTGLDMVIDGHSHETYNRTVTDGENKQIPIAQTGSNMKAIGRLTIYWDGHLEETLIDSIPEPTDIPFEKVIRRNVERFVDPEMKAFLDEIVAAYAPVMDRKVGEVSYDMIVRDEDNFDVSRNAENGLCDFVADAFRTVGGTQTAIINAGTVRNNMKSGTVTYNNILNILPYSSDVITVRVSGQMLLDALEFGVSKLPAISAGFPQVSGITFRVNQDIESSVVVDEKNQFVSVAGEYRVSDVMIGQEPLDLKAEYTLAGTSYLLNGGDGYSMFKEADTLTMTMLPDNEVVIKYIEEYLHGVIPEDYREARGRILK